MSEKQASSQPVRLGIIGTGLAVEKLHWPALKRMPNRFGIVAFSNRGRANAEHFAGYSGTAMDRFVPDYHDLLAREDVDAVLISLPIPLSYAVSKEALEAGKHVICEKPPGVDADEGRAFIGLAADHPELKVLIAENFFYRDDLRFARSVLDDGRLGRIHLVSWRTVSQLIPREGEFSSTPWRHDPGYEGGAHLDGGVHHTAQLRFLCGDVERLSGEIQDANDTHGGPSDLTLNLRFVSGAIGNYTASYPELKTPAEPNELRLYGTEAVMSVGREGMRIHSPDGTVETFKVQQTDGGYYNEFLNFHEAVALDAPIVGTVVQSFRNMELVLSGLASAERGEMVTIDPGPGPLAAVAVPLWKPAGETDLFAGLDVTVDREVTDGK